MEGPEEVNEENIGMISRAVQQVFTSARSLEANGWKVSSTSILAVQQVFISARSLEQLTDGRMEGKQYINISCPAGLYIC